MGSIVDLKVAWWNCSLAPPSTQAKKKPPTLEFLLTIMSLLEQHEVDILGLCEVDREGVSAISDLIQSSELNNLEVIDLYRKEGNSIDDFCLIINKEKLRHEGYPSFLTRPDETTGAKLRTGAFVQAYLPNNTPLAIILCHWQSRNTYCDGSHLRRKLGDTLRQKVSSLLDEGSLVVICGDFNDEPFDDPIQSNLAASRDIELVRKNSRLLYNPYWNCLGMNPHDKNPAGTCLHKQAGQMSYSKTFDQIIFSSGFVGAGWNFVGVGAKILHRPLGEELDQDRWASISDHYPVISHVRKLAQ
jgi:endonuclease/exonuclease/phosphatase family metal-dependent hydrolase